LTTADTGGGTGQGTGLDCVCVGCGYDLRACDSMGQCPECGKPVLDSLNRDAIERTDRVWARDMALGVRMMFFFVLALLVYVGLTLVAGVGVAVIASAAEMPTSGAGSSSGQGKVSKELADLISMVFWLFNAVLFFLLWSAFLYVLERLTRKEPNRESTPRPYETWRSVTRILLPVVLVLNILSFGIQTYQAALPANSTPGRALDPTEAAAAGFYLLVCLVMGVLLYSAVAVPADVATRIESPSLQSQAKRVVYYLLTLWGMGVLMLVLTIGSVLLAQWLAMPILGLGVCLGCSIAPVMVILGIVFVVELLVAYGQIPIVVEARLRNAGG
jgi:hypothetical protein